MPYEYSEYYNPSSDGTYDWNPIPQRSQDWSNQSFIATGQNGQFNGRQPVLADASNWYSQRSPVDAYGTTRNQFGESGRGLEGQLISPREDIEQQISLAKAHYEVMKTLSPEQRLEYLRNYILSVGGDPNNLEHEAAGFMNMVYYTPSKDTQAAAHGHTDRDFGLGSSDAKLFFGNALNYR